jgi:hypothetical protein
MGQPHEPQTYNSDSHDSRYRSSLARTPAALRGEHPGPLDKPIPCSRS